MAVPFDPELKIRQLDGGVQAIYRHLADLSATQARHTVRLDQIAAVQDQQSATLAAHTATLADHTTTLADHTTTLAGLVDGVASLDAKVDRILAHLDENDRES